MKKDVEKLQTIDAETLVSKPFEPIRFIIDEILPIGLHILAGSPKVGKSWLMLWLCSRISNGFDVWGLNTNACEVLYLCLEDNYPRIQSRLFQLDEDNSDNFHISTSALAIGEGLEDQIKAFIEEYPNLGLVVIDTFQKVRMPKNDNQVYSNDYRDLSSIKQIADEKGIAIIVVHHLRKSASSDPFNMISGSTGLTGAADSSFILLKESREENEGKLCIAGRDIAYQELILHFENLHWELVRRDSEEEIRENNIPMFIWKICEWVRVHDGWTGNASELKELLNIDCPVNRITQKLNQHKDALMEKGIQYDYCRTGQKRIISLVYLYDSSDSYDGRFVSEEELSQPSLLSQKAIKDLFPDNQYGE